MEPSLEQELVNKVTDLLTILSKRDALTIFLLAKDGLNAEADTPQKIGLTRKQYYTRLKQLVDTGLIDKSGNAYLHTTLGTFVYQQHILELMQHVSNAKQMKMVDILKRSTEFSEGDIAEFVGKIAGLNLETTIYRQVRFAATYEQMVSDVIEQLEFAKSEILLASRFQNDVIINNMLRKADAGVNVRLLVDKEIIQNYIRNAGEKLKIVDKNSIERLTVAVNPYYPRFPNVGRKIGNVPFCILIVDRKRVGLEIIDRFDIDKFKYAFFTKEEVFADEVRKIFESWWLRAEEDNPNSIQKLFEETVKSK